MWKLLQKLSAIEFIGVSKIINKDMIINPLGEITRI